MGGQGQEWFCDSCHIAWMKREKEKIYKEQPEKGIEKKRREEEKKREKRTEVK